MRERWRYVPAVVCALLLLAPASRAAVTLSIDTVMLDLRGQGPVAVQVPVRVEVTDAPVDLGAVNLAIDVVSDDPVNNTFTIDGGAFGDVFGPTNFTAITGSPLAGLLVSDFGDSDISLAVGTHRLADIQLTLVATRPGDYALSFVPGLTQLSNSGGAIAGVALQSGLIDQNPAIIPEPASLAAALLPCLGLVGSRRRAGR